MSNERERPNIDTVREEMERLDRAPEPEEGTEPDSDNDDEERDDE